MEIDVQSERSRDLTTIGTMEVNDGVTALFLFTLEDEVREGTKIYGETAIPAGRYRVTMTRSAHFNMYLPELHDVPDFSGVRIHSLNNRKETKGCIGVGLTAADTGGTLAEDVIGRSREAMRMLFAKIARPDGVDPDGVQRWAMKEETWINVRRAA